MSMYEDSGKITNFVDKKKSFNRFIRTHINKSYSILEKLPKIIKEVFPEDLLRKILVQTLCLANVYEFDSVCLK